VSFLGLLGGGNDSSSDGPDGLVSDDNVSPVLNVFTDGLKLSSVDFVSASRFSLIELLSDASHHAESVIESILSFAADLIVGLSEDMASLTVP
jgi:hypothetical protein